MAQDNNINKFYWLNNVSKKDQVKHFKCQISLWEKKIKELEGRKMNSNNQNITTTRTGRKKRGRKPKYSDYHYEKRISSLKLNISKWLIKIKEIEDTM